MKVNLPPLVSVIVVSHERPTYLSKALDSITQQSHGNLEIIVVDNKSRCSDEIANIVNSRDGVKLVQNSANLGFTGAMNKGIETATGHYIHLTVDDVIFDKDCIQSLADYMEREPSAGLLSGILYDEDGSIRCAGGCLRLDPIHTKTIFGEGEKDVGQFKEAYPVEYVPGGMIFGRTDLLKRLKGFRHDFFIYSEDSELCARVSKLGYAIVIVPEAKATVLNVPHAFTPEGIAFHKFKNLFALYLLHAELSVLPEFLLRYGLISFPKHLRTNRKLIWPLMKAWGWFLAKTPSLISERFRNRSLTSRSIIEHQ